MAICENCYKCPGRVYPQMTKLIDTRHRPILVITETITAIEAKHNQIMTGTAGSILKQTMLKVGLPTDEDHVAYTAVTLCAVPHRKGNSTFPSELIRNCRDRLLREILAIKPKIVLACGKTAMQALTGNMKLKVSEEYGRVRQYNFLPGITVIPIMHPGLIARAPGDYKAFVGMLQLAATIYKGGTTKDTGVTEWTVLDTPEKIQQALYNLHVLHAKGQLSYVACDVETTGLDYREAEFLVMGVCYAKNKVYIIPREMRQYAKQFLENVPWKLVWQHGKYDKKVLWKRGIANPPIDDDIIYMHYALDETSPHDLGYLSKIYLQAEEYKYKMNQNWKNITLETYPKYFEGLCERVAVDCDYTYQLVPILKAELEKEPRLKNLYENLLIPAANFLARVEQNGILINPDFLQELNVKYDAELDRILAEIEELAEPFWDPVLYREQTGAKSAPERFNPGSPQQMAWMIYDRLKLKPRIKKGRSTNKEVLKSIEPMPKLIAKVLKYRTIQKEQSTYVKGLLNAQDDDGRVRTTFNLHVTTTGRLSSSEPNVQNQPSVHGIGNIRRAFISRKGYILAEVDYSGAELRWLAFLSSCPVLTKVFLEDRNLHDETARALYGPNFTKEQRMRAKAVNFGIPYGREAQSFVDEFAISKEEAQRMIDGWLDTYYGAKKYLNWCAQQVIVGNYLETPFGRRRRFGLVTPESLHALQNEARNFPIQSSSSDLLLVSAMDMEKTLLEKYDTYILNLIHDSILLEIPAKKEIVIAVSKYTNEIMTKKPVELFNCFVPFKTDFEIGFTWGDLVAFNYNTGNIEVEKEDGSIEEIDFNEWLTKNQ